LLNAKEIRSYILIPPMPQKRAQKDMKKLDMYAQAHIEDVTRRSGGGCGKKGRREAELLREDSHARHPRQYTRREVY